MASRSLFRASTRPDLYICARCALRASQSQSKTTRRWIGMKYLAKVADAEKQWKEKAESIRAGKEKSMLTILEERGLVQTITGDRQKFENRMTDKRLGVYVGIDPTAASLHIGHLLPMMSMFWMYVNGYHTVQLLGGATAKIGDPTDRLTTREKEPAAIRTANMANMHLQLKKLWNNAEAYGRKYGYKWEWPWHKELVNNNAWWNKLPMLEVLQVLGPGMRLGSMLARDTVKNKMSKGDGMSYAEFSYPLMQAWDWWHMYHSKGISMQIGGSDQYGNITAGIAAIKYISTHHPNPIVRGEAHAVGEPLGFTSPLLTTSSGQKFGKSTGNAIWLDPEQTSPFDLYGYFLRTSDEDVGKYLKMFTFMPLEDIDDVLEEHKEDPSQRKAQHVLARDLVELVHGPQEAKHTQVQHALLFHNKETRSTSDYDPDVKAGIVTPNNRPNPNMKLPRSLIFHKSVGKLLYASGLASSSSDGHRLANNHGAYVGGPPNKNTHEPMNDGYISWSQLRNWSPEITRQHLVHDDLLLLRRSKHNVRIILVVSDEEYALSGETYPGMEPRWREHMLKRMAIKEEITKEEKEAVEKMLEEEQGKNASLAASAVEASDNSVDAPLKIPASP
ncbi:hypothetical protein N431DRAFT_417315 [Stipitochalara longipes BDJ]|nr:hypothetical protein N431DRAFT_417315 [Stipitochalara longipes BDJ]